MIAGLRAPRAYPHPTDAIEVVETHISWIVLTGEFAYKIKKPVNLGFLDFSDLARRRFFCQEELRLNRRFAPDIYLSVEPIGGPTGQPKVGCSEPLLDYAVKMRQFDQRGMFLSLLAAEKLGTTHIDRTADAIAEIHRAAARRVAPEQRLGSAEVVRRAVDETFRALFLRASDSEERGRLAGLAEWAEYQLARLTPFMEDRRQRGFVRECHGDLHLGNLVWVGGRPVPFDCIEFDPALRWIDIVSEIAFLGMDLEARGAPALAYRFLNRYETLTGDYAGLRLWDYFRLYRALVRAKVSRLSMDHNANPRRIQELTEDHRRYLDYAESVTERRQPRLFITHGLSGSGKSFVAEALATQWPAIWLRSDIERKRICVEPDPDYRYSAAITQETYARLCDLAATLLEAGQSVIVDGTFLRRHQRAAPRALADRQGAPFTIIDIRTPLDVIEQRIVERTSKTPDPSEATIEVVRSQCQLAEEMTEDELLSAVQVDGRDPALPELIRSLRGQSGRSAP